MTQLALPTCKPVPPAIGGVMEVWPEDRAPSKRDLDAFAGSNPRLADLLRRERNRSAELAVRRTAASLGIAEGRLGMEDRLTEAGTALEAIYGPFDSDKVTCKNSLRVAWLLGESAATATRSPRTRSQSTRSASRLFTEL